MGLRELKKEQTRLLIAETAWTLFADRGFDRVTIAEIAREAQVAPATVFNYFANKEDLFFFRLESFGSRLVDGVRARPTGEPVLPAVQRLLLRSGGLLAQLEAGDEDALDRLRERQLHDRRQSRPAGPRATRARRLRGGARGAPHRGICGATGDDLLVLHVVASALIGVQRALIDHVRARVLAEDRLERLPADVRRIGKRAFALLAEGLGNYAAKSEA